MSTDQWFKDWYERMHAIYNSEWDSFLREYVFAKEPPFVIQQRPAKVLGESPATSADSSTSSRTRL